MNSEEGYQEQRCTALTTMVGIVDGINATQVKDLHQFRHNEMRMMAWWTHELFHDLVIPHDAFQTLVNFVQRQFAHRLNRGILSCNL